MDYSGIQIVFKPSKKQFAALQLLQDQTTDYIGYGGSAFSGKSYLLCYWLTICCIAYPGTGWGLGRKELINLKKTTLLTLFKVFAECGIILDKHFSYNQQQNLIEFKNGSTIFLIDTAYKPSDPLFERFGSLELTGCAVDESAETKEMAIEILSSRTGRRLNHKYNLRAKFLETFNPSKGHVYKRYYKPYATKTEFTNVKFIKALPSDNPSPEVDAYVARMMQNASKITIERLIKGNFEYDDDPDALISYDKIMDLFSNTQVVNLRAQKYITSDIARMGSDLAIVLVWHGWVIIDMVTFSISKTTDIQRAITALKIKHGVPNSNIIADEDGVGGGVVDNLNIKGFVNNSKAIKDENYQNLKTQCYYKYAERVERAGVYWQKEIASGVREVIVEEHEQIKAYEADKEGKLRILPKEEVKQNIGHSPDYTDALAMREWFELKGNLPPVLWQ